jgi:hypothetical protein
MSLRSTTTLTMTRQLTPAHTARTAAAAAAVVVPADGEGEEGIARAAVQEGEPATATPPAAPVNSWTRTCCTLETLTMISWRLKPQTSAGHGGQSGLHRLLQKFVTAAATATAAPVPVPEQAAVSMVLTLATAATSNRASKHSSSPQHGRHKPSPTTPEYFELRKPPLVRERESDVVTCVCVCVCVCVSVMHRHRYRHTM